MGKQISNKCVKFHRFFYWRENLNIVLYVSTTISFTAIYKLHLVCIPPSFTVPCSSSPVQQTRFHTILITWNFTEITFENVSE